MPKTAEDKMVDELRDIGRSLKRLDDHTSDNKYIWQSIARLESEIVKLVNPNRDRADGKRPCYISKKSFINGPKRAIFHGWIELKSPNMTQTLALVEYEVGVVEQVKPSSIIFTDSKPLFDEFYWAEEDEDEETEDTVQIETGEQTNKSGNDD